MRILIGGVFLAAAVCAVLSYAGILSPANLSAPVLFGTALILVLLRTMNPATDRTF